MTQCKKKPKRPVKEINSRSENDCVLTYRYYRLCGSDLEGNLYKSKSHNLSTLYNCGTGLEIIPR